MSGYPFLGRNWWMYRSIVPLHVESCTFSNSALISRNMHQTHFQALLKQERRVAWFVKIFRVQSGTATIANPWSVINSSRKLEFSKFMAWFAKGYCLVNWITWLRTEPWSIRFHQWGLNASIKNFDTQRINFSLFSYVIGIQHIQITTVIAW